MEKQPHKKKPVAEQLLSLSIFQLHKDGLLEPGKHRTTIGWLGREERVDLVTEIEGEEGSYVQLFDTLPSGTQYEAWIWLKTVPCPLKGKRWWFACPHCQPVRLAGVLYFNG